MTGRTLCQRPGQRYAIFPCEPQVEMVKNNVVLFVNTDKNPMKLKIQVPYAIY
jgi:hypothetical protein